MSGGGGSGTARGRAPEGARAARAQGRDEGRGARPAALGPPGGTPWPGALESRTLPRRREGTRGGGQTEEAPRGGRGVAWRSRHPCAQQKPKACWDARGVA